MEEPKQNKYHYQQCCDSELNWHALNIHIYCVSVILGVTTWLIGFFFLTGNVKFMYLYIIYLLLGQIICSLPFHFLKIKWNKNRIKPIWQPCMVRFNLFLPRRLSITDGEEPDTAHAQCINRVNELQHTFRYSPTEDRKGHWLFLFFLLAISRWLVTFLWSQDNSGGINVYIYFYKPLV